MKPIRILKAAAFAAALTPAALLAYRFYRFYYTGDFNALTANPGDYITDQTGTWALAMLVISLTVTPLRRITVTNGVLRIGALATYTGISRSRQVRRHLPMLVAAAREIGGIQIQNRGTLGGNIANASPAGDTLPVLAAAEAVIVLESQAGERRIPFTRFYTGYRATVRQPDELITAVEIPPAGNGQWFRKVGTRAAQAISKVSLALGACFDAAGRPGWVRVSLGAVAPTVIRAPGTEAALLEGDLALACEALAEEVAPIDDLRSTAEYRRAMAGVLLRRAWREVAP